jgi:general secretion pathway protein G
MIVIVIIGLLAGAVTLSARHFLDKAKENRARSDLSTFKSGLAAFYADNGRYPANDEGLTILVPKYIEKLQSDPWGRPYQYNQPGRNGPYEILCLGPDGKEGSGNISSDDLEVPASTVTATATAKASP